MNPAVWAHKTGHYPYYLLLNFPIIRCPTGTQDEVLINLV
jgi:hypothetical protein